MKGIDLEEKVKEFLKLVANDKTLEKLYTFKSEDLMPVNAQKLKEIIKEPFIIESDDETGELYYFDNSGERVMCPEMNYGISEGREWISESIPMVPFDITQDGNLRRALEAENIYKCLLVAGILKGDFQKQFVEVVDSYDFENFQPSDVIMKDFSQLLSEWQELQNLTIRIIVSGANLKISSEKNLEVGFLIGSLNKEETLGVISMRDRVKSIIRGYMMGDLSKENMSKMTKIERLIKIQEKDDEVLQFINLDKQYSELYKICSMNADYLPAKIKLKLNNKSNDFASKEVGHIYKDDEQGYKKFLSLCRRRAYKEAVIALKEREIVLWRQSGNSKYKLPPKF